MVAPLLAAIGGGGGLLSGFFGRKAQKVQNRLDKKVAHFNLAQAIRNRKRTEMDARLSQRMAEERAADAGTYDPSEPLNVGVQAVRRVTDRNALDLEGARQSESLAASQLNALKKQIKKQRQQYYLNSAINLLQLGLGAYSMIPSGTPDPRNLLNPNLSRDIMDHYTMGMPYPTR